MRRRVLAPIVAIAVAILSTSAIVALRGSEEARAASPRLAPYIDTGTNLGGRKAPTFSLQDQFGRTESLAQWRGKVVVLAFVDDQCTTICPLTTQSMALALHMLGPAAARVELIAIDANPLHTSVADVATYLRQHGLSEHWRFLTGSLPALKKVWRDYGIAVAIQKGQIDHTPALYVIDRQGRERRLYLTASQYAGIGQEAYVLAREAASLLPGQVRVAPPAGDVSAVTPGKAARLPLASGGSIAIGPGHAHLYLFLDAWAPGAARQLQAVAQYRTAAARAGLPSLVLVDVRDAEATPQALPQLLSSLPALRGAPLAVDLQGRVADGYGVLDIPWFALTDRKGKVVWSNDGWLPAAALLRAARQAP
jgi:cytochrome oxidase Cu insertion factor (SCO1/SenC/PrrC family)